MKLVTFVVAMILSAVAIVFGIPKLRTAFADSASPPAARTGAPTEASCAGCHSGNSGNEIFEILPVPPVTEYVPGNTYIISVGIDDPNMVRWGFEATALKDSDNSMAGTFGTLVDAHVTTKSSGGRTYVCQTTNGVVSASDPPDDQDGTWWSTVANGPVAWAFQWTAPPQGTGSVTFYASGVAANGDSDPGGDNGYVAHLTLTEGAPTAATHTTWGQIKQRYR
jgi:hypothetical protein